MKVIVTDRSGREHELEALEGWRVMEVVRDWGVSMKAECGGAGICGTCHVHVDPAFADKLPEPNEDELDQLDQLADAGPCSRLSCQILMSESLDGIRIKLGASTVDDADHFGEEDVAA